MFMIFCQKRGLFIDPQDNSGQITAPELQRALVNGNWSNFSEEACRLMIGNDCYIYCNAMLKASKLVVLPPDKLL